MDLQTVKIDVIQKLIRVSRKSLLNKINKILDEDMIVGYTVEGKPLTKKDYNNRLQIAEAQILSGEYLTQDDLEKESKNW